VDQIIGNINDLLAAVQQLAVSEENKLRQAAAEKVGLIQAEAMRQAGQIRADILAQARQRAALIREQSTAALARQARNQYLLAREQLLAAVWEKAEQWLHELTEQGREYANALQNLFLMAVRSLYSTQLIILLEPRGRMAVNRELLGQWQEQAGRILGKPVSAELAPEPLDTWGGLVVKVKGTTLQIDATFASRLETAKTELREPVFDMLMKRFE
jgi:vacuolar-type H+-ATPase subunit E/Vma4